MTWNGAYSVIRYSVAEELDEGSIVANLASDLGLDAKRLIDRDLRIDSASSKQYVGVNKNTGDLYIKERIDRERLCGNKDNCFLNLDVIVTKPLKIQSIELEIIDVNDSPPYFASDPIEIEIYESSSPGDRISLDKAIDSDVGKNRVRAYYLSESEYFDIDVQKGNDGSKFAELVLRKALDREEESVHNLVLTAVDGGEPSHSGTVSIIVRVLDTNDNAPHFDQLTYNVSIAENALIGTIVVKLNATDEDEGSNAEIVYSFSRHTTDSAQHKFALNPNNGEVNVKGELDYEDTRVFELYVQAKDKGMYSMTGQCTVLIHVADINDNSPEITIKSLSNPIYENVTVGTVIALVSVSDRDSGENGKMRCEIRERLPFTLQKSSENYYALLVKEPLDRETVSEYNITIIVADEGFLPLSSNKTIHLELLDVNDNAPSFGTSDITISVEENNAPGTIFNSVSAVDLDLNANRHIRYSILDIKSRNSSVSKYFSINPENGNIYALQSLDYEEVKAFRFCVEAVDSGVPPLSSNVTVHIIVLDQNDNSPVIVSPWRPHGSVAEELIPRSTDKGYLVTKVIAIDADSVQNSRITYQFLQITDSSLFSLDQYNGEIRTMRMFSQRDSNKQKIVVLARDNGEPALSSTVTIRLSTVSPARKVSTGTTEVPVDYDLFSELNLYLLIGLGAVVFLFLITVSVIIVLKCQRPKPVEEPPPCRNSFPSLRNSMNSQIADSTLISSDAYWYSLFLAETRKGKVVVRQTVPNGAGYIVSSIPRSTGLTETSDSATSTLQRLRIKW
nr:PREDICTED: protocadherin alpha-C2-like isoform X2 [Lepisosteus oculatus]